MTITYAFRLDNEICGFQFDFGAHMTTGHAVFHLDALAGPVRTRSTKFPNGVTLSGREIVLDDE